MIRTSLLSVVVLSAVYGCSGNPVDIGALDSSTESGSGCQKGGFDTTGCGDSSVDVGVDGSNDEGGPSTCRGTAPNCYGDDDTQCCGQDPSGSATCVGGEWKCGSAKAPGCNGKSCLSGDSSVDAEPDSGLDAGVDTGIDASPDAPSTCLGSAPLCFGNDDSMCCGQDPSGLAVCVGTDWRCGKSLAPGCDGKKCLSLDAGPPIDGPYPPPLDASPPPFDAPPPPLDAFPPPPDAGQVPDGFIACGSTPCLASDTCVITTSTGPVCFAPDDAGLCAPPYVRVGVCCTFSSTTYTCHKTPGGCGGAPSCGCAKSLCGIGCSCVGASGEDLDCLCAL